MRLLIYLLTQTGEHPPLLALNSHVFLQPKASRRGPDSNAAVQSAFGDGGFIQKDEGSPCM